MIEGISKLFRKKQISLLSMFLLIFFILFNLLWRTNAYNSLTDLFQTDNNLIWKSILVPLSIKLTDYNLYWNYVNIKIELYDWFNKVEAFNDNVKVQDNWLVNILVSVDPTKLNLNKNIVFKIFIDNNLIWQISKQVIAGASLATQNAKKIIDDYGKVISIDNLLLKTDYEDNLSKIEEKINKYKKRLLSKTDIKNYVMLKNGKLDFSLLPFSMNNLACNIQEPDLKYIEDNLWINIDRTKVVYNMPCADWMTDLHILLKIIRAYNQDDNLLKNYSE